MLKLRFYQSSSGRKPAREFITEQPRAVATILLRKLELLSKQFPASDSIDIKNLGRGLLELRVRSEDKNYRIIFSVEDGVLLVLHIFIKKARRAQHEIKVAYRRLKGQSQEW